jgi:hypothetical protein
MPSGIGATLTSLINGTTADGPTVTTDLQNINNGGIANDGGLITTDGLGDITAVGLIVQALFSNPTAVSVAGTTSGTATLYQFLQGTTKAFMVYLVNYRNSTTTEQVLTLPVAFTRANYLNGNIYINLYKSGSKITNGVAAITTLNSTAGSSATVTPVPPLSIGELAPTGGFDALGLTISMAGPTTGILFAIGF